MLVRMSSVRSQAESTSDDAVRAATGRSSQEWFALLDVAGAGGWPHQQIAAWLVTEHGVDGWWAQGVTVRYEQARGRRRPGQRPDGTYSVTASVTLPGELEAVRVAAMPVLADELGPPTGESLTTKRPTARWRPDGTTLAAQFDPVRHGAVRVTLSQERLPDEKSAASAKKRLRTVLARLR